MYISNLNNSTFRGNVLLLFGDTLLVLSNIFQYGSMLTHWQFEDMDRVIYKSKKRLGTTWPDKDPKEQANRFARNTIDLMYHVIEAQSPHSQATDSI